MKAVITCDDVFDALTRQPFPSGGVDDEVVESHLAVCHECRQLAEAFRPAVGLFHESLSAGFDDALPMYRGRLKPIIDSLPQTSLFDPRKDAGSRRGCERIGAGTSQLLESLGKLACPLGASPIFSQLRSEQRHSSMRRSLAVAASLVLVGSVVFALWGAQSRNGNPLPAASTVLATQDRDDTLLAALEIPSSCRSMLEYSDRALAAEFVCCTKCHHAASRVGSSNLAISKTTAACAACHDRVRGEALSMAMPCNRLCESLLAFASIHNL